MKWYTYYWIGMGHFHIFLFKDIIFPLPKGKIINWSITTKSSFSPRAVELSFLQTKWFEMPFPLEMRRFIKKSIKKHWIFKKKLIKNPWGNKCALHQKKINKSNWNAIPIIKRIFNHQNILFFLLGIFHLFYANTWILFVL